MKWVNHRVVGFSLPFAFTGLTTLAGYLPPATAIYFFFSLAASAFSTLPDSIEGRRLILKHRGISHNLFAWLLLFGAAGIVWLMAMKSLSEILPTGGLFSPLNLAFFAGLSLFAGVLTHLLADALTMTGVPLSPVKKRFALKLFRTGAPIEYVISLFILSGACLINYKFFLSSYLYVKNLIPGSY